jgi:hypothetical protein
MNKLLKFLGAILSKGTEIAEDMQAGIASIDEVRSQLRRARDPKSVGGSKVTLAEALETMEFAENKLVLLKGLLAKYIPKVK